VKDDIAIGVYRHGADAWQNPELYHLGFQAGAPPDDFAVKGQNWGFPTYNWQRMREDGFAWWKQRFEQMSDYFDAFRIDHILGFFRIWSIPMDAVEGIMGHFVPAIPVHINEFNSKGIWFDHARYTKPFITENVLWEIFGYDNELVKSLFLKYDGFGSYTLRPEFVTQRLIEKHFATLEDDDQHAKIKQGLYDLVSNVILFEEENSNGLQFHFRFGMEDTSSFRNLESDTQQQLKDLYVNYFFRRQDDFWMKEALQKLPALKRVTNMLVCGEDLGLVPACVPDVMRQLGLLSLEIQRMPKDATKDFFHPNDAPYLSVVTPSTHDMSTIRGWWEEDRERIQKFYNHELGQWGDAPYHCEAWINKAIVVQHLYSPAMWSVFQLQDLLGMDELLRREDPNEERINIPANPKHYWQYRTHLTLEELLQAKDFNDELRNYIHASGR
jgi:4-alpha-glucanotransferase